MSRKKNPGGVSEAHIRLTLGMLNAPAWVALSTTAKALFVDMRSRLRSTNNGNISCPLSEMKHRGWRSSATLSKGLKELEAAGFIRKTRTTVGVNLGSKVCSLFRFTDLEAFEHVKQGTQSAPATCEYKKFESLKAARAAIDSALQKKRTIQKLKRDDSESEAIGSFNDSESEAGSRFPRSKTEASNFCAQAP